MQVSHDFSLQDSGSEQHQTTRQTFANLESRLSARPARSCDRLATAAKFWAIKDKALLLSSSICSEKEAAVGAHRADASLIRSYATAEAQHRDCSTT